MKKILIIMLLAIAFFLISLLFFIDNAQSPATEINLEESIEIEEPEEEIESPIIMNNALSTTVQVVEPDEK